jgi:hypothetical protein
MNFKLSFFRTFSMLAVAASVVGSIPAHAGLEVGDADSGIGPSVQEAIDNQHAMTREKSAYAAVLFEPNSKGVLEPKCQVNLAKNQRLAPSFIQIDDKPSMDAVRLPECSANQSQKALALADHSSQQQYALLGVDDALITAPIVACASSAAVSAVLTGMAHYVSKGDSIGAASVGTVQSVMNSGAVRVATMFSRVYQFSRAYSVAGFVCGEAGVAAVEYLMH